MLVCGRCGGISDGYQCQECRNDEASYQRSLPVVYTGRSAVLDGWMDGALDAMESDISKGINDEGC